MLVLQAGSGVASIHRNPKGQGFLLVVSSGSAGGSVGELKEGEATSFAPRCWATGGVATPGHFVRLDTGVLVAYGEAQGVWLAIVETGPQGSRLTVNSEGTLGNYGGLREVVLPSTESG